MSTRRGFLQTSFVGSLFSWFGGIRPQPSLAAASPSAQKWDPKSTWVFAVGVLVYPDGEAWPQAGRRDSVMIEELKKSGVPPSQIEFVRDKDAQSERVLSRFRTFISRSPAQSTLWFYFAGHGAKDKEGVGSFVLYDKNWMLPELFRSLEKDFKGHTALLFADCCYSGNLGLEAMMRAGRIAYGVLTSSLSSVQSTGAWTFTNCLIQGLKGEVDIKDNQDNQIDFLELAAFTEREMAANDGQLSTFVATNGFDPRMVLKPGIKQTHPRLSSKARAFSHHPPGTKVSIKWDKKWYPGSVITGRLGMHLISYDGYSSTWDEWVDSGRLKPL